MLLFVFLWSLRFDFHLQYAVLKLFSPAFECCIASEHRISFILLVYIITIYAPINFTARVYFFGLVKSHELLGECDLEPKKVEIHGPNPPSNGKKLSEKIIHGAIKFIGA